jgi:hypothetical protein
MKAISLNATLDINVLVEGDPIPYVPAYLSGLPENCYPESGGYAESIRVYLVTTKKGKEIKLDITDFLTDSELDVASDLIMDEANDLDEQAKYEADEARQRRQKYSYEEDE